MAGDYSIIWLRRAQNDVRAILSYIANENAGAGIAYISALKDASDGWGSFPNSGRRYDLNFRCLIFRNHLIFYRVNEEAKQVRIVSVLDGRRDLEQLLESLKHY